jgi:phosphatidylglycerophosphatase A
MQEKKQRWRFNQAPDSVWTNPVHFIACGFGVGAFPIMPGTAGTLACIPFVILAARLSLWWYLAITLAVCLISMWSTGQADKDFAEHDHPATVSDEYAGFFVTMIAVPISLYSILIGFVLFRLFDIWKPWPISWMDKNIGGGLGVVLDDVAAGALSCAILQALLYFHVI